MRIRFIALEPIQSPYDSGAMNFVVANTLRAKKNSGFEKD
jgi:hypothetical protein